MIVATATFAAAATSRAQEAEVISEQIQLGDVFSGQTLNVVDVEDQTTAVTVAAGNTLSGAVEGGDLSLTASQNMYGDARATTVVNGGGSLGAPVTVLSEAVGNTGDAGAYGANLDASVLQTTQAGTAITARSEINATVGGQMPAGGAVSATAIANSQAFGVSGGELVAGVTQNSSSAVEADVAASVQYMPGDAVFSAAAIQNNVSSSGTMSAQTITADQVVFNAPRTRASTLVTSANAWAVQGAATATANNIAVTNADGPLTTTTAQTNGAYLQADTVVDAYAFGLASAQANGVGNSMLAGNNGPEIAIDSAQLNSGGVEVSARFNGSEGYDAYVSSTAMGNAATGYACSECEASMNVRNRQTNDGGVSATSTVNITGSGRNVVGTSTAVGNSASFWVSSPGG